MPLLRPLCALLVLVASAGALREGHAVGVIGTIAGLAGAVAVMRARGLFGVVLTVAMATAWAFVRAAAMPDEVMWRHLEVQRTGQGTLIVAWAGLVAGLILAVPPARWRGPWVKVGIVAVATLAWASHPALALLAWGWALWVAASRKPHTAAPAHPVLRLAPIFAALLVVELAAGAPRSAMVRSPDPRERVREEIARENPWRALAAAHAWAATGDGQGLLAVARIAASLGLTAEAEEALGALERDEAHRELWGEARGVRTSLAREQSR